MQKNEKILIKDKLDLLFCAVEQSPSIVIITDKKGIIEYANLKFSETTGYSQKEVIGKSIGILKSGAVPQQQYQQLWEAINSGNQWSGEFYNKKKDGTLYWETASISPIKNKKGEITHFIKLAEDVTHSKELGEKLKETIQIQSYLTSIVSHELRTPLTAIKQGLEALLNGIAGEVNPQQQSFLVIVERNVERLQRLITDLLDFQKLKAGKMEFTMQKHDINETVYEIEQTMTPLIKAKGLKLYTHLAKNLPKVRFDKDRIIQVLTNIVNNAVKFTETGSITICTKKQKESILISVSDTGIGIKKDELDKLFKRFKQLSSAKTKKAEGTGLGLSISRQIVQYHQGRIWAESEEGKGTTFYFTLPI